MILLTPEWVEATSTAVYALVTIGALIYIICQTKILRCQVEIAYLTARTAQKSANAFVNSERAWITVKIRHDTETDKLIKGLLHIDTVNLECDLLNCGKSPARLTYFSVSNRISKALDPNLDPVYDEHVQLDKMLLAPNDSVPMPLQIKEATLQTINADSGDLYVYGIVYYLDAFDKQRFTRFCLFSSLTGRESGIEIKFRRGGPAAYSKAT